MKIKHMLAVTALILIFAVTACTQYVFEFPTDKEITTVEDLVKFMQKHEKDSAKVNLTIDPDNSYLPITINGNKTITGKITIKEDSPFPFPFSSVTTYATKAGATNLFEIADNASLSVTNFEASVTSNAADSINAIIYVNGGEFNAESFTSSKSVTGLSIGPKATASSIDVNDSNIRIVIDEGNAESDKILDNITENNPSIPQDDITTRFDAENAEDFFYNLFYYEKVILTKDFSITYEDLAEYKDWQTVLEKETQNSGTLHFNVWKIIKSLDIDLNGHTLTSYVGWYLPKGEKTLSISNGNLNMQLLSEDADWNLQTASIELTEDTSLIIDDVDYKSDIVGIFLSNCNNRMTVNIYDSYFDFGGFYGIGTNATGPESEDLTIGIYGSTITTENCGDPTDPCSTTILFNVKGNVTIEDSTIIGNRQAMIARGGNYDLRNSKFKATGNDHDARDFILTWGQGNQVPLAAIVFGNNNSGSSYAYSTKAKLDNVTIEAPSTNRAESPVSYHGIYIWQNNATEPVTVEGSIRRGDDCEVENLYNTKTNDADVDDITILN